MACAVTASERGEIGLIVGRIGMGAAFEGSPLVHVDRLFAAGLALTVALGSAVGFAGGAGAGDGAACTTGGGECTTGDCCGTAGALTSRWMSDFLNQLEVLVVKDRADSDASLKESLVLALDCLRLPSNFEEDLGRRGSRASLK